MVSRKGDGGKMVSWKGNNLRDRLKTHFFRGVEMTLSRLDIRASQPWGCLQDECK